MYVFTLLIFVVKLYLVKLQWVTRLSSIKDALISSKQMGLKEGWKDSYDPAASDEATDCSTGEAPEKSRTRIYKNMQQYPDAAKVPGILVVRVDSVIYFSNSNSVKKRASSGKTHTQAQI
ncbi:hypothetical protein Vadar_020737 [Vaccinium darrowii]|uniref:Uncharacterized protein n=1 Tax=Vaccinium darrowii TaxID=229202 RepID=A0ACB7X2B3_9ERIC|nr:hypothetical protein Vadar_020737 [Vaccinium darrowii]